MLRLPNNQYLFYALPAIASSWLMAPIGIIQGIYAKYFGVSLTSIATVLLLARLFDAVTDPIIGGYTDIGYQLTGSYKPFIFCGGMLFVLSSYFLYTPPEEAGIAYFTIFLLAFYFSWTLFEIPHLAWASELAATSDEKVQIFSYRSIAGYMGLILFYTVPLLPIFETQAITPETLKLSVIAAGLLMIFLLTVSSRASNSGNKTSQKSIKFGRKYGGMETQNDSYNFVHSVLKNKPLLVFLCSFLLISTSSMMWYSLIFLYVDSYLGAGDQFAEMFLLAFVIGILSVPIWQRIATTLGNKFTWGIATLFLISSYLFTGFLTPANTNFAALATLKIIQTLGLTCMSIVAFAMLCEIIDYSEWKYRNKKRAVYFAMHAFLYKSTAALATALGLSVAGWFGFDASADTHSQHSVFGISLAIAWLPPVFAALGLVFLMISPINKRRHDILHRRLVSRETREDKQFAKPALDIGRDASILIKCRRSYSDMEINENE